MTGIVHHRIAWVEFSKSSFSDGRSDILSAILSGISVAPVSTPYEVLLSQLGTLQYRARYGQGGADGADGA